MVTKKSPMMAAIEARAKTVEKYLGETVLIRNLVGTHLTHPFTRAVFRLGGEVKAEFDSFLSGQLLANRISVTTEDGEPLIAPHVAPAEEQKAPVEEPKPAEEQAPETPAQDSKPEGADGAPAAKPSILKKPAA